MSITLFHHPQETWNEEKCEKLAKYLAKDGLGTKYPFKGYLGSSMSIPPKFGMIRYNGGCVRNNEWYDGEFFPLPILAKGFAIVQVISWGYRIIKLSNNDTKYMGKIVEQ